MTKLTQSLLTTLHPPLYVEDGDVIRIGKSRVSLDTVVECFEAGMSPEKIIHSYDTLELADVQSAIKYDLAHRADVQAYMNERADEALALRKKIEAARPPITREQLLARRDAAEKQSAPSGH